MKARIFKSLTGTVLFFFFLVTFLVLVVSTGLGLYFNFYTQKQVVESNQQIVAQEAADKVHNFIQDKIDELEISVRLVNPTSLDTAQQQLIMEKLIGIDPSIRQVTLLDLHQHEVSRVSRLVSTIPLHLNSVSMTDMYSQVSQKKTYISSVIIDESSGEPLVIMAVPVTDELGDLQLVKVAEVNLKFMWDIVENIHIGTNGLAFVVDKNGYLIAFKDISRVLQRENVSRLKEVAEFVSGTRESETEIYTGIIGTQVVSNYVALTIPDWAVVIELPVSEAYSPVGNMVKASGIIFIIGLLFSLFVSFYLAKRITRPIIKLRDAALDISSGKLETQMPAGTTNEISQLSQSLNDMSAQLLQSHHILEEKVEERTNELNSKIAELEEINQVMVGRELKMIELKKQISDLEKV